MLEENIQEPLEEENIIKLHKRILEILKKNKLLGKNDE